MTDYVIPQNVLDLRNTAQQAMQTAGAYAAGEPTVSDVLRQKVTEAYANNQDIVAPLDKATTEYLSAPATGREKYQDIFNPFARERLVSQYVGTQALPMLSLSNIYGNRVGRIEDTIGAGTRGYQAAGQLAQNQAQLSQQAYQDSLNEWKMMQDLNMEQQRIDKSGGGGSDLGDLGTILATILNTNNQDVGPTEPMPDWAFGGESSVNKRNTPHYSPGGEWVWDPQSYNWVPVVD